MDLELSWNYSHATILTTDGEATKLVRLLQLLQLLLVFVVVVVAGYAMVGGFAQAALINVLLVFVMDVYDQIRSAVDSSLLTRLAAGVHLTGITSKHVGTGHHQRPSAFPFHRQDAHMRPPCVPLLLLSLTSLDYPPAPSPPLFVLCWVAAFVYMNRCILLRHGADVGAAVCLQARHSLPGGVHQE